MPLNPSSNSVISLQAQAENNFAQGNYERASVLFEELIAIAPEHTSAYWYLGLSRLLQGHESEAQLTWMMALSEADADQAEQWTEELLESLRLTAEQQEQQNSIKNAWLIRRHFKEIAPDNLQNLLKIVQLSIQAEQFAPEDLQELGLIQLLHKRTCPELNWDQLFAVLQQVLEVSLEAPGIVEFLEACLPYVPPQNGQQFIAFLLPKAQYLSVWLQNNTLACRYGEFCFQLDENHSEVLMRLASYYQNERSYEEGIEIARRFYSGCQTIIQKMMGNAIVLRGLMSAGARWQEAQLTLENQTTLIQDFIKEYQYVPDRFLDASLLCTPLFFYPYFGDKPGEIRPLQNQVAAIYQADLLAHLNATEEKCYAPYPIKGIKPYTAQRKLRIGYLSRFLRRHSVGWLARWVFEHYDRDRFEVYLYLNQQSRIQDFTKNWFASKATQAYAFEGDFLGIAKDIQADEIDILVELDSLTSDYTCGVVSLKPAPIQVTWLGLDASGLPAIDYFLADPYVLPELAQSYYSEKIWRLPQTYIAVDGFEVAVPTLRRDKLGIPNDAVIYFSAQAPYKRNPETIRLQMKVIKGVPNSYFLIKGLGDEAAIQSLFHQIAEEEGVSCDRLRFLPRDYDEPTHRANLAIADVVLDTFPYNGATTTMETLWMGIPLVTKVGQQFAARNSYTMMVNAGISEGIAWSDEEYIEWGIRLGQDEKLRQDIQWRLMKSRQTAPLWNGKQFTRDLEAAYEQMWQQFNHN